jgi:cell division protein FtsB
MDVLHEQLQASVTAQQTRLAALQQESRDLEQNLKLVGDAQTTAALDFRNQLASTQLLLSIETGDAAYRLDKLRAFLGSNF